MNRQKKVKSQLSDHLKLTEYLKIRLREADLTLRAAAEKIGISYPYLSQIMTGKRVPEAAVCVAIADAFGDPRVKVLRYAGWLDDDDLQATFTELERLAERDPQFLELIKLYRNLDSHVEKQMLIKMIKAALSK